MTIPLNPLRSKFQTVCLRCKQKWHHLQEKIQRLLSPLTHEEAESWPPAEELSLTPMDEGTTMAAAHWPLDDKNHAVEPKNMVIVEVKYFPKDPYSEGKKLSMETEDPNLRITHYPPSNRLH